MPSSTPSSRIALVLGTRPQIIRLSPLVRAFECERVPFFIIHSNLQRSREVTHLRSREGVRSWIRIVESLACRDWWLRFAA